MTNLEMLFRGTAVAIGVAASWAAMTTSVSADVVYNSDGDCWHVSQRYTTYPEILGVQFYSNDWHEQQMHDTHYHWRDNPKDEHGYYMKGEWHSFDHD